jgi:adenosylhomocysteine nucleosidase
LIAIIGAMDEEVELYKEELQDVHETSHAGIIFYSGTWRKHSVVLCKSGVGKVNASVCTQILIDLYKVRKVIFTGVAGAVNPSLEIGDIVISKDCMQHDMDATALGFQRGEIPFRAKSLFPADEMLLEAAAEASKQLVDCKTLIGRILSGDQFVADRDVVRKLREEMQGDCTEMEGAAVAQVCDMSQIPFVIVRSMSDKADGSAHVNFAEFTKLASRRSFEIVSDMLARLPH